MALGYRPYAQYVVGWPASGTHIRPRGIGPTGDAMALALLVRMVRVGASITSTQHQSFPVSVGQKYIIP